jgi:GNAT superfamily N-acetyltransferase
VAAVAVPAERTPADSSVTVGVVDGLLTRELRRSVLRPELSVGDPLPGDEVAEVVHFGVLDFDERVVSTCLIFPDPFPGGRFGDSGWHLRQMATHPDHRGHGHGLAVLDSVVDYVAQHSGGVLWCDARQTAIPFYERSGFSPDGELFIEHAIPHLRLWRIVSAINPTNATNPTSA